MFVLMFTVYEDFLAFLMADNTTSGWEDVANSWFITTVVVAILGIGLILGFKAYRKSVAGIARNKIWTRRESWLLVFVGIFPIFLILLLIWYTSTDYFDYAHLLTGTLLAWLIYLVGMVIGHLVSPWKRELI